MTTTQLRDHFNKEFSKYGAEKRWPESYEVDHETYANVCQSIFSASVENGDIISDWIEFFSIRISVGKKTNGIMFKNVELILKKESV